MPSPVKHSASNRPIPHDPPDATRVLMWTPMVVGGLWLVRTLTEQATRRAAATFRRPAPPPAPTRDTARQAALRSLAGAVLGNSKQNVARVLGTPRVAGPVPPSDTPLARSFWDADTWYYLLDPVDRFGLVIEFDGGFATTVEMLGSLPDPPTLPA